MYKPETSGEDMVRSCKFNIIGGTGRFTIAEQYAEFMCIRMRMKYNCVLLQSCVAINSL